MRLRNGMMVLLAAIFLGVLGCGKEEAAGDDGWGTILGEDFEEEMDDGKEESGQVEVDEILRFLEETQERVAAIRETGRNPFAAVGGAPPKPAPKQKPAVAKPKPAAPSTKPEPPPILRVEGILAGSTNATVRIAGKAYGVGDRVGSYVIRSIESHAVSLEGEGTTIRCAVGEVIPTEAEEGRP